MNEPSPTERLYYRDSRVLAFAARVVAVEPAEANTARICLDRTAFYPEGGGQPCDHGILQGAAVIDVTETDGIVWHTIQGAAPSLGAEVEGKIDAARRFDHMQQHTGQHLLSRVFVEQLGLDTTSFHLGVDGCSIDLATPGLSDARIVAAEERAAEILRDARPVRVRIGVETEGLALRKDGKPAADYRVISIDGFDDCACGGTHVENTAQIESIIVRRVERINDARCRVEFLCGGRARRDARSKRERLRELSRLFSADEVKLLDFAKASLEKQKDAEKRVRELSKELMPVRAERLLAGARVVGDRRLLIVELGAEDRTDATPLAAELAKMPGVVAALVAKGSPTEKGLLVCACGPNSAVKASEWVSAVLAAVGGKGGGSPHLAQGGFGAEHHAAVKNAVENFVSERIPG